MNSRYFDAEKQREASTKDAPYVTYATIPHRLRCLETTSTPRAVILCAHVL